MFEIFLLSIHLYFLYVEERFSGHEFEQAPGDSEGQGSLACCSPWGRKKSGMTERPTLSFPFCLALISRFLTTGPPRKPGASFVTQ